MKRFYKVSTLAAALFGMISCGGHETSERTPLPTVPVQTVTVKASQIPTFQEVIGTVRPGLEARISAQATGRIVRFLAAPGMRVEKGELLAELEVKELRASLDRAQATLDQANSSLSRYRNLLGSGAATQAEFDRVEAQQRVAEATVRETNSMIANATVMAPFSGVVTQKFADTGDLASPGRPLLAMEDSTLLRLEIDVAESLAGTVTLKQKIKVHVAAVGADLEGTVSEIAPAAEAASRTFLMKLDLPSHPSLRAGQFGRAFVPRGERSALIVPADSVFSRGQMDYVFVATGEGVANLRIVRAGARSDAGVEILAGVEADESVILSPAAELRDGYPVKLSENAENE
ncbi:MAG: efflux RND transporter periplasmic adaptor subunit [Verrucomicrobiae bacterium]|nr:efflux RND transporter periplasmic adaptor subunit [Verrucomicrobiae bacterium]